MTPPLFVPALGRSLYPGASVALDFTRNLYRSGTPVVKGSPSLLSGWTFTRASTGYAETAAGALVAFASGAPRITDKGLLVEEARTNVVLWNRDLTNAAWTKTSITAVLDQTGADGVANSASSLTATGANGTCLQAITLASSARFQTARVKRITGSGVVEMTMDNGATWTAISPTSAWTRVSIPTQTLANLTVGFRIVTSGDAIAVDFVQNENGTFSTSDIPTTTPSAARAADFITMTPGYAPPVTMLVEWQQNAVTSAASIVVQIDSGANTDRTFIYYTSGNIPDVGMTSGNVSQADITIGSAMTAGQINKVAGRYATNDVQGARNGTAGTADTSATAPAAPTTLRIGHHVTAAHANAYIRRAIVYPYAFTDAQLSSITA